MITTQIIEDSRCKATGIRITTFLLSYPRFVHAELMTHRAFSRNAASSRAIPIDKMIQNVMENPAMPLFWGANQKGMQATHQIADINAGELQWLRARDSAVAHARELMAIGAHKQIVNRVLEPWLHITTLVTATDYDNWFGLRSSNEAQPEIAHLSDMMLLDYQMHEPFTLNKGEWHIPFTGVHEIITSETELSQALVRSVARCARTSYDKQGAPSTFDEDEGLFNRVKTPGHWSPFEHQAECTGTENQYGNFVGWKQYRYCFPNQKRTLGPKGRDGLLTERLKTNARLAALWDDLQVEM